jgi:hypothetical protein
VYWHRKYKRALRRRSCAVATVILWVRYDKLGLKFQSYDQWIAAGAHIPGRGNGTSPSHDARQGARSPHQADDALVWALAELSAQGGAF